MSETSKRWTFTARRIEGTRITGGFSMAWYPRMGWGACLNLLFWYVDVNYRRADA